MSEPWPVSCCPAFMPIASNSRLRTDLSFHKAEYPDDVSLLFLSNSTAWIMDCSSSWASSASPRVAISDSRALSILLFFMNLVTRTFGVSKMPTTR